MLLLVSSYLMLGGTWVYRVCLLMLDIASKGIVHMLEAGGPECTVFTFAAKMCMKEQSMEPPSLARKYENYKACGNK